MTFEIGGRFEACPNRDVYSTVDIDPQRVGWRLEASLWEYPDTDEHSDELAALGGAGTEDVESAKQWARVYATAAWVAVRDYFRENCPGRAPAR